MIRMVIADDEWLIRESLHRGINWGEMDINVVGTASDGIDALKLIEKTLPHFLLTDIRMPGMDGLELIRIAKQTIPNLKTIIISGFGEFEYAQRGLKIGANDYILKPIDESELIKIIRRLITDIHNEDNEKLKHTLLNVIQSDSKYDQAYFKQFALKTKYAFVCWTSLQPIEIPIEQGVISLMNHDCEGVLFIEEADQKREYFQQLHNIFEENNIIGSCSTFSEQSNDLPSLYKQALMVKTQNKFNESGGGLFFENASSPINMEEVLQFISENFESSISLQELAARFFISDSYFSRIFKQYTGQNFIEFLTEFRIKKAKDLLTYSSMKTNEISLSVGYTDQRYFSQIFKKYTGMTPSSYKKMNKGEE